MTSSSSRYSLRSNAGGYALRSKGASPPPIQCPKSHKSRSAGKLPLNEVSRLQEKLKPTNPKKHPKYNLSAGKLPLDEVPRLLDYLKPMKPVKHQFHDAFSDSDLLIGIILAEEYEERKLIPKEDLKEREEADTQGHEFATAAISYLREQGRNFELVEPAGYGGATISTGARFHHNFMAKRANDPSAPVETFFAQLRYFWDNCKSPLKDLTVECCVSLGKSDSLPDERVNPWCGYCSRNIHHPVGGCAGIEWGNGYPVQKGV